MNERQEQIARGLRIERVASAIQTRTNLDRGLCEEIAEHLADCDMLRVPPTSVAPPVGVIAELLGQQANKMRAAAGQIDKAANAILDGL